MTSARIVIIIVKAAGALRDRLVERLQTQPDFILAGAADRAHAGRTQILAAKPHVVLVNAALGGSESIELIESIAASAPATKTIVIDVPPTRAAVTAFLKAGARGFVARDAPIGAYERTIRSVASGAYVVPAELIGTYRTAIDGARTSHGAVAVLSSVHMTQREREIATLMVAGAGDAEIAAHLKMSSEMLDAHYRNILEKLVLHTRIQITTLSQSTRAGKLPRARAR